MKYGEEGLDGCVFPAYLPEEMGVREGYFDAGMTKREHAAISLRIPNSGDEQLDAMLRQANRRDAAVAAMQGICAAYQNRCVIDKNDAEAWAEEAIFIADALITKLEESNDG